MVRYLILSAALVIGGAVLATAWANRDLIRITIAGTNLRVPPKPGASNVPARAARGALRGDAPWALSALPECLSQTLESTGSARYVRKHLPANASPIVPPATLVYGDCTIVIAGDEAFVRRGADRLRIPPRVRFYRSPARLALIRDEAQGSQLRVYESVRR
jgi:hypothetical protein